MNMKIVLILYFTVFILITNGYKLAPYRAMKCPSMLPFKENLQTTFLDLDEHSNTDLKTCALKNLHNHSIVLISGCNTHGNALLLKHKITEIPNVVILTKKISLEILELPSVKRVLQESHHAPVYFIVTDNERFQCKEGVLKTTDFLLLETFMNQIWHSYSIMRAGVTFPLSCKEKVAIYSGKRRTDKILYDRTIKLINLTKHTSYEAMRQSGRLLTEDYPLRANIFYRFSTAISDCKNLHYYTKKIDLSLSEGYCGVDALVMHDIVKHFKFNLHFPKNDNCYKYGYLTSNNVTGSLGCIVRNELDISFNSRFMTKYSDDYIYFMHFVAISSLCAVVKRPDVIPIDLYAISAYRPQLWMVIVSLTVAIGMVTWVVATIKSKMVVKKKDTMYFYITDAFTSLMFGFSLKKKGKLYILRGTCLCSSILFAAMYQGHVNHMFTTLIRFDSIKTLDTLYKSDYTLYLNPSMKKIMKQLSNPENTQQNEFLQRSRLLAENYSLDILMQEPFTALIGRKEDVLIEIFSQYTDEHERPLINIVDECFYTYYLSYITRAGFPFYEEMQRYMQRLGEAGLPVIYHKWTSDMLQVPNAMIKNRNEPRTFQQIKLEHERIPFGILLFGYTISLIVFMIELVRGRRCCRN